MSGATIGGQVRRRIVVTGAAGFVGSHVVERLSAAGRADVVATDVVRSPRAEALASLPGVRFKAIDLRDTAALEEIVAGADCVVHLAAVRTKAAVTRPREAYDINVSASYDVMAIAAQHAVRRFVFGSTQSVYGAFAESDIAPIREEDARIRPGLSMYAASKLGAEAFLSAFAAAGGPQYLSLRFGTVYGPRGHVDSNGGILLQVLQALDRGERPAVPWTRDSLSSLIHVDDVAESVVRAVDAREVGTAVNVVSAPVSAETMYTTLVKLAGGDPADLEWRNEGSRYQVVSQERMRSVLGLEKLINLEDGLSSLIAWYRETR